MVDCVQKVIDVAESQNKNCEKLTDQIGVISTSALQARESELETKYHLRQEESKTDSYDKLINGFLSMLDIGTGQMMQHRGVEGIIVKTFKELHESLTDEQWSVLDEKASSIAGALRNLIKSEDEKDICDTIRDLAQNMAILAPLVSVFTEDQKRIFGRLVGMCSRKENPATKSDD